MSAASRGDLFAFYGLLRTGESGFAQFGLAEAFIPRGPCLIPGRLYDLGAYPGLVGGKGAVIGELFALDDPGVLAALDAFEDYYPEDRARSRYDRLRIALTEPAGETAWVYVWLGGLTGARLIESGDWLRR